MRFLRFSLLAILSIVVTHVQAGNKIKYYFNHPVDNTVSSGVDAVNLNGLIDDTLIAYINRANYTLDMAIYNFTSNSGDMANVANAINAAYLRGVKIRWIDNGSSGNTGVALLNAGIPRLSSPTSSSFTIMHNKFMIVDAHSPDPEESIVWTGSTNWSVQQFTQDYDNVVILQDSALAHAYTDEFNQMWGDTGMTYNLTNSKFGHLKTDLGRHNFTIDGKQVELYFSPSDGTNNHIISSINSANKDLYFGVYTFTYTSDANAIAGVKNNGVYVAGILDNFSTSYSAYPILNAALGANLKVYNGGSYLYHNKYLIVDPSDACSDPQVLTGSHNWSSSANTDNDENTLIIHDATAANVYLQAFRGDFYGLGGSLTKIYGCTTGVPTSAEPNLDIQIFPNPTTEDFTVAVDLPTAQNIALYITDVTGRSWPIVNNWQPAGMMQMTFTVPASGIYILKLISDNKAYNYKIIKS